jgi:hypothetical protein
MPNENNRPMGENSPNLVTLLPNNVVTCHHACNIPWSRFCIDKSRRKHGNKIINATWQSFFIPTFVFD